MSMELFEQMGLFSDAEVVIRSGKNDKKTISTSKAEEKVKVNKPVSIPSKTKLDPKTTEVDLDFTISYSTRLFLVSDLIDEVPESGKVTLEQLREVLAREYYEFTESRTRWEADMDLKRLYVNSVMEKMGMGVQSPFRSFHWDIDEIDQSVKPFQVVASRTGQLMEIRKNSFLQVTTPVEELKELKPLQEGIQFLLKPIPIELLKQILNFFRIYSRGKLEVLAYIVWDKSTDNYECFIPRQQVKWDEVISIVEPGELDGKEIVFVIHSHHQMDAYFSPVDDENDQALRFYGVAGCFHYPVPEIRLRAGFNGKRYPVKFSDLFSDSPSALAGYEKVSFDFEWLRRIDYK